MEERDQACGQLKGLRRRGLKKKGLKKSRRGRARKEPIIYPSAKMEGGKTVNPGDAAGLQ